MLELLKAELDKHNVFNSQVPEILTQIAQSIPNQNIPERMKLTIAVAEMILFASHFRRNVDFWNGSQIPVNMIAFSLAKSGDGKDSSVNAARKCFNQGYEKLNNKRNEIAIQLAKEIAAREGVEDPNDPAEYKPFYHQPPPLFVAPSTTEGFIQHLNDLEESGVGAGFIYSGEFGGELVTSSTIISNLQILAELYDEGKKEVKVLKNREAQSRSVNNLPVSAFFLGSQDNILFDSGVKEKFKREFSTKLARRGFFNFNPENVKSKNYTSVDEMVDAEIKMEETAKQSRIFVNSTISRIVDYHINKINTPLKPSTDVRKLFTLYKKYNEEVSNKIKQQYSISRLVRKHLQWKALKLAGAFAFYAQRDTIEVADYKAAIAFVEMLDNDMLMFEQELVKEPYELFVGFMHSILDDDNTSFADVHTLKKMSYITGNGSITPKIKELIYLASAYDSTGIYTECEKGICFEKIIKTNACGLSYLEVSGTKEERARNCATGYKYGEFTFAVLGDMLTRDVAYSPFKFRDGNRGKEYIEGGAKWLFLDIDKSAITDEEAHRILANINHHIVRTSNPDNAFKFRILIELDSEVDLDDRLWKPFTKSIADYLSVTADSLPKAQIAFSYSGRNVLSVTDKEPLEVRDHLLYAHGQAESSVEPSKLTKKEKEAMLADSFNTFYYAFEAMPGARSLTLIRAAKHAKDLDLPNEAIIDLMWEINDYWDQPLEAEEIERNIISQIERW